MWVSNKAQINVTMFQFLNLYMQHFALHVVIFHIHPVDPIQKFWGLQSCDPAP